MSFEVDNKPAFEIPLKDISQATTGKEVFFFCVFFSSKGISRVIETTKIIE